jgi:hypothetical protein
MPWDWRYMERELAKELDGRSREFYEFTEIDKHSNEVNA